MLQVAAELFKKASSSRSGVASTHRSLSLQTMVPFVLPSTVSTTQNTRCGRGMIVPVTCPANKSEVIKHNLGRFAQFAIVLINQGNFTPQYQFDTSHGATRTLTQQSVIFNGVCDTCLVLFF